MIIKHGRHIVWEIHEVRKDIWAFFFRDCALRMLIGWAGKLRSRGVVAGEADSNKSVIYPHLSSVLWHAAKERKNAEFSAKVWSVTTEPNQRAELPAVKKIVRSGEKDRGTR